MRIGIWDNDIKISLQLKEIINNILEKKNIKAETDEFTSGRKLMEEIQLYDGIFLDIEMSDKIGIKTGKMIKNSKADCFIIATGYKNRYREAFHIKADDFITKPFNENEIEEALNTIIKEADGFKIVELYKDNVKYDVRHKDIAYIEAYDSHIKCYTENNIFRSERSLTNIMKELDDSSFFRVSRGFIINMKWIDRYEKGCIYINDEEIAPARRRKKEFEKAYIKFELEYR